MSGHMLTAGEAPTVEAFFQESEAWAVATVTAWGLTPSGYELHEAQARERSVALSNATSAHRRSAKLQRTAAWADKEAMKAIYARARQLTTETGIVHHVDHDIPLLGKLVSGLHVETNLRIITGSENCRKNNRFEVEL